MNKCTLEDVELSDKRVFIRADFNVPLDERGEIREDTRIRGALPTIRHAMQQGARIILASHMGRPKGKVVQTLSLRPVAKRLSELLGISVDLAPDCIGPNVKSMVDALTPGKIVLLENVRFHAGETANDPKMAAAFAELADVVVNDAFGTAHRAHASNVGIVEAGVPAVAGKLMAAEIDFFNRAVREPERPLVAILGGSKVSTKINVIQALLEKVDKILIGGAMAFTFFRARGLSTGDSLVEEEMIPVAQRAMAAAEKNNVSLILPVDAIIGSQSKTGSSSPFEPCGPAQGVAIEQIPDGCMGLDIGPETCKVFKDALKGSETVVWNGPMGVFEHPPFDQGTLSVARSVAESPCLSVIGGGDTDAAIRQAGVSDSISYISTGGGAFLELLEGRELPGIAALDDC